MASILYLGTDKGVITAKSDNGASWRIEHQGLSQWSVPEVAVSPTAPNRVFAGTRGDGVWLSDDFGASWVKPCYGKRGPGKVRCLTIDPHDLDTLYAGTEPIDVFISRDAGKNWQRLDGVWDIPFVATVRYPVARVEPHVRDIVVDPKDSKIMYIALQVGYMLKSVDGGEHWELLNKNLDRDVHAIVMHPQDSKTLYVTTGGHDCRAGNAPGRALYESNDGGANWQPMADEFREEYSVPLAIHPKHPDRIYSTLANGQPTQWRKRATGAESLLIRSDDGGKHWHRLDNELARSNQSFVEAFAFDPQDSDRMYAVQRSGDLFASDDAGERWRKLEIGVPECADMKAVQE